MADIILILAMLVCAFVPFATMARLMLGQQYGYALTIVTLLVAAFVVLMYIPLGLDFDATFGIAFVGVLPAIIGSVLGAFLGYLMLRRRFRTER